MNARNLALVISFSALYAVFCVFPIFQIIGFPNKAITIASVMAPVIGIILGPYLGVFSTMVGGLVGLFYGIFSHISLVAGVVTAFCAGMLKNGRRDLCAITYLLLLLLFGFCPYIGPVWLYPQLMWFHIFGFAVLISPIQSMAFKNLQNAENAKNRSIQILSMFFTLLVSTLAGQIAGSLVFELTMWLSFTVDVNGVKLNWQAITFIYPVERVVIALGSTFITVALHKTLKSANFG